MPWICPKCGRTFGRANQPHSCRPSLDLDDWLAERDPVVGDVLAAVRRALSECDPVIVEATSKAVMIKRARTFAEVKPGPAGADVAFVLPGRVDSPRIVRSLAMSKTRIAQVVEVSDPQDVDAELAGWLVEAFERSPV